MCVFSKLSPGIKRLSDTVIQSAKGSWIYTTDGREILDFTSGLGVTNLGHTHPKVVQAAQKQLEKVTHQMMNIAETEAKQVLLTEKLPQILPPELDTFFLSTTGAEAVEYSLRAARMATGGRPNVICFAGAFHGRSHATLGMTTSKANFGAGAHPKPGGYIVAPYPHWARCPTKNEAHTSWPVDGPTIHSDCDAYAMRRLKEIFAQQTSPTDTAAIIIEVIQGEGGYVSASDKFLKFLRSTCDEHGIMLIFDEVQTGFWRTGKPFAFSHSGVVPDIVVMAKGLANGLPLSGIAANREKVMKYVVPGSQGGTFGGNAVSCAAACAVIDTCLDPAEGIEENIRQRHKQAFTKLQAMRKAHPRLQDIILDFRGKGMMFGIEFDDRVVPEGFAAKVSASCLKRDMYVLTAGAFETIRLIPPIIVTEEDMEIGINRLMESILENADF